ncbi:HAMP domain-containing protein [bacterium]|nr:MAG: HAMP domain-containing protein [bacterium]
MKLRTKIIVLTTIAALSVGLLINIFIRGIVIHAFRGELERRAISIAGNLSDRIASFVVLGDHFQTTEAFDEVLRKEADLEYIFVTDSEGKVFSHTFTDGFPPDITTWNPLNSGAKAIQLLDTEKGFIRDVGVKVFRDTKSELHVGIREDRVKNIVTAMRDVTIALTAIVLAVGVIASFFVSRLITRPLNKFVDFTEALGRGEFNRRLDIQSRDEIGYLAHRFNRLSMELRATREKMEEAYTYTRLLQAEKLSSIGQISAGLAHELKNPIATLKMLFQAFQEQPDMTKEDADVVHNEIEKIDIILTRFLGFLRHKDLKPSEISMNTLIDHVLSLATFDIRNSGIKVHKDLLETLPAVQGDRSLLEQVFLNLILNAVQAMPGGGEMRISGKDDEDFIEVMIWDKGSGISQDLRSKIFDPFFTTKEEGTGLGLSIAYNIVKSHGGTLYFNSSEGGGTVFTVRLPKGTEDG